MAFILESLAGYELIRYLEERRPVVYKRIIYRAYQQPLCKPDESFKLAAFIQILTDVEKGIWTEVNLKDILMVNYGNIN